MARAAAKQATHAEPTDGRLRRSTRSREKILDALSELIVEGNPQPTAEKVAARARVGLRTVFRHFDDLEGLHREMHERHARVLRPLFEAPIPDGTLAVRIRALVRSRAIAFEKAGPLLRSRAAQFWRSRFLTEARERDAKHLRLALERALPETTDLSAERRAALELATSFESWDRLRTQQRLGSERAQAVVVETATLLLGARRRRSR